MPRMKSFDRSLCESIGRNRRAIEKIRRKIKNSMSFHEERGSEDWPKWMAMGEKLIEMEKRDETLTQSLKEHRADRKLK